MLEPLRVGRPGAEGGASVDAEARCETHPSFALRGGASPGVRMLSVWCLRPVRPSPRGAQGCLSVGPSYWVLLSVTAVRIFEVE